MGQVEKEIIKKLEELKVREETTEFGEEIFWVFYADELIEFCIELLKEH